jgi:hypothetical protein
MLDLLNKFAWLLCFALCFAVLGSLMGSYMGDGGFVLAIIVAMMLK